ncbi:hypothetical protein MMC15_006863 [Xylographa vitiligo]|nr:hypothetical protein [Xylographa vitiligo]
MSEKIHSDPPQRPSRWRQFSRPDGRTVHVAASPAVADALRRQLSQETPNYECDLVIHGSPEHLDVIREIHAHNEEKRIALRLTHTDVYEEFEKVHAELDALSAELSALTDKDVALDANFSRYGYSAHIRTREVDSSATSVRSQQDREAERLRGESMKFWKKPVIRQYFHKGLIWRASETTEVASFELFVDLLYVGIIAINGDRAAEDPTGTALLQFCLTFILSWKLWSELTLIVSWFETDDILQRLCVLFFLVCLTGYTTNITDAFGSTYTAMIAFYLSERLFQAAYFLWTARLLPMIRGMLIGSVILILVPSALWIGSTRADDSTRLALIWVAIPIDLFCPGIMIAIVRTSERWEGTIIAGIASYLQFYPAVNIEHKTERTNAFVTVVFGYSVVALLYQNQASYGINAFFGKAILGLIQVFTLNMIYFDIDSHNLYTHAIRRHYIAFMFWMWLHLLFIMSFVLASGALSKLVLAHDCADADPSTLTPAYAQKSEPDIDIGLRWFYCAGLGIALACMGGISASHSHKTIGSQRVLKRHRLAIRFAVALILVCLPLAAGLTSLGLLATTTGLVVFVLVVDLWGCTCEHEAFWRADRTCRYSAECMLRRKDIEAMKMGGVVDVEDLARRDLGAKGVLDLN